MSSAPSVPQPFPTPFTPETLAYLSQPAPGALCGSDLSEFLAELPNRPLNEPTFQFKGVNYHFYFSYGAMCNPVSMRLRQIFPLFSSPADCPHFKLSFGINGMANIENDEENTVYGVLHVLNDDSLARMDAVETGYDRKPVAVVNRAGVSRQAMAYQAAVKVAAAYNNNSLPGERYLDVIAQGCLFHGVSSSHIDWLANQPNRPRPRPSEFLALPEPESDKFFSQAEVSDPANNLTMVNGKVLQWCGPETGFSYKLFSDHYRGRDAIRHLSRVLYEPIYPVSLDESNNSLTDEHRRYVEDYFQRLQPKDFWKIVGRLEEEKIAKM